MKSFIAISLLILLHAACTNKNDSMEVSTSTLLMELLDMKRLSSLPDPQYKTIQFSSFDRRSTIPGNDGWFENSDGFGGEPIPGFIKEISAPDSSGTGEYLICELEGSGAIVRSWTARINGSLEVYFDGEADPAFSGPAEDFFWNIPAAMNGGEKAEYYEAIFRQNDACYFPLAFSRGCKIIWKGRIDQLHFYHLQFRLYSDDVDIKTFETSDIENSSSVIDRISDVFSDPGKMLDNDLDSFSNDIIIPADSKTDILTLQGSKAIRELSIQIEASDIDKALKQNILSIYFDDASIPQVHAPVGDFFGAGPGINPYQSLPFTVMENGSMICRYPMPFIRNARVQIDNRSDEDIIINYSYKTENYTWISGCSMHFRAKWRIDHGLTASNKEIQDIPYLMSFGEGRFVGAAAFIKNPSNVPSSWGNWWGEGDEKIFVDSDYSPSTFGTGSEDYFNYSWSSSALFDYAYCGQPRNDGPANRGFVSNYRFQIIDDIPFFNRFAFFMELFHHGELNGFDYGRIVYYYATPGTIDENMQISDEDVRVVQMPVWNEPEGYLGSAGSEFIEAERIVNLYPADRLFNGYMWSGGRIFYNNFTAPGEKMEFRISLREETDIRFHLTMAHTPESGKVKIFLKGMEEETGIIANLYADYQVISRNHSLKKLVLPAGNYSIIIENMEENNNRVGVDFIWLQR